MTLTQATIDVSSVLQPVEKAVGLPNSAYAAPEILELERQKLFADGWVAVAFTSDVPNAGDIYPVNVHGAPLAVVRDQADTIRVFHNVCRHRGATLVQEACSGANKMTCPYHAWAYALDGRNLATPRFNGVDDHSHPTLDGSPQNLISVRSTVWNHIIFVNLNENAKPLEDYLSNLTERWAPFDLANTYHGGSMVFEIKANWKLVLENFLESYHLPKVHPELNRYSPLEDHVLVVDDVFMGQLSLNYAPDDAGIGLPRFENLPEDRATTGEYLCLFPNLMLSVTPDHYRVTIVTPVTPELTHQRWEFFFVGEESKEEKYADLRQAVVERVKGVTHEDIPVLEMMQAGRHSPGFDGGRFSPFHETTTHKFQQLVAQGLSAE
ncbi:aromatic ring-hydroxylating oxygenase subunit alpha [Roseovarius sp. ZX-A-9]|uniref:aromatic ring-hydroxylating oxygenase subunit alpha n=1 Tax=Roseovarius sp. ZX-A-9 TaxID=3014783 RepID=UPI00232EFFBB|nr:aromatic ring-hydroxylating dioxygenase subunit alpha [Roseovarius sp. ZX-A-9]